MADEATTTAAETQSSETGSADVTSTTAADSSSQTTETKDDQSSEETVDLSKVEADKTDKTGETETKEPEQTEEQKAAAAERAKLFGAPEGDATYEITGLPEGVSVDNDVLAEVTPIFKELDLSAEGASKVAGVYAEKVLPIVQRKVIEGVQADIANQTKTWEGEARSVIKGETVLKTQAGRDLSFDGKTFDAARQTMAKALDTFAPAGFREFLDTTGLGMNPQMIAFVHEIGKRISEDTEFTKGPPVAKAPSRTEKYYPQSAT